jgi:hypothetical protein
MIQKSAPIIFNIIFKLNFKDPTPISNYGQIHKYIFWRFIIYMYKMLMFNFQIFKSL